MTVKDLKIWLASMDDNENVEITCNPIIYDNREYLVDTTHIYISINCIQ